MGGICAKQINEIAKEVTDVVQVGPKDGETAEEKVKELTLERIAEGLKAALAEGIEYASKTASALDGYFMNPFIKIPWPDELRKIEEKCRDIGFDKQCDEVIETMNRAAEEAAKTSVDIFQDAIMGMTIQAARNILDGTETAATDYLKETCGHHLHAAFLPIIKAAIEAVEVTKYWDPVISGYNSIPLLDDINFDLDEYVLQKALEGLWYLVAEKEKEIRANPLAVIPGKEIIKEVFSQAKSYLEKFGNELEA